MVLKPKVSPNLSLPTSIYLNLKAKPILGLLYSLSTKGMLTSTFSFSKRGIMAIEFIRASEGLKEGVILCTIVEFR